MLKRTTLLAAALSCCLTAFAQVPGPTKWPQGARAFSHRNGVIYADGKPFPLIMDFTWSAERNDRFYEFAEDWGNTTTYGKPEIYGAAAGHRQFYVWSGGVAHDRLYLKAHPDAAMMTANGKPAGRSAVCFLDQGYREYLRKKLVEIAKSLKDKPFLFGYYPQDEFAYRCFGGFNPVSKARFRERLQDQYKTIATLNTAWGSDFKDFASVEPPTKFEKSRRFCDWQAFRRWAQLDFAKFVYDTLKQEDPKHAVVWSLPFWGSWANAAAWWDFPAISDVLMRHGIGYRTGAYRIHMLRDIAEWSGVPGNALAMPPDYYPGWVQMSLLMDCPRTGLSHVCIAGAPHPAYQGVADSSNHYARREPMFTVSRSINIQQRQLGGLYLLSKSRPPQVGVYVSDRTLLVNGISTSDLNGMLNMLYDLNIDFQILSERNLGELSRYPAIIVGPFSRVVNGEIAALFRRYVSAGGNLIMLDGAFAADWYNRDAGAPGHGFDEVIGSTEAARVTLRSAIALDGAAAGLPNLPAHAPVFNKGSIRKLGAAKAIGTIGKGRPVVTFNRFGKGTALYMGARVGLVYYASWTEGYRDVLETNERAQVMDENAYGYDYRPPAGPAAKPAKGAKAWAQLLRAYLRSRGIGDHVVVEGYTDGIGVLKVKSFRKGGAYWVGLANRIVTPGADHRKTPPEKLHKTLKNLRVQVQLDAGTAPELAWVLPNTRRGKGRRAVPEILPMTVLERDGARWACFTLPTLIDFATVALLPAGERAAVMGIATNRETLTAGDTLAAAATLINTSGKTIAGALAPGLEPGLAYRGKPARFTLAAGERFTRSFEIAAPTALTPGFYQVNMVATLDDGRVAASPWVEARVLPKIDLRVNNMRTIFPLGHLPPVLSVTAQANGRRPVRLTARVELPEGFGAQQPSLRFPSLSNGRAATVTFRFTAPDAAPRVAMGKLRVEGDIAGEPYARVLPIRLAVGAVIYERHEDYQLHASMAPKKMPLLALENSHILATIIPNSVVVHDLVLRDTGHDHLVPASYPLGWSWYSFNAKWRTEKLSPCGASVSARIVGRHPVDHKPITMTFSLGKDDNHILIDINTNGAGPVANHFCLISRIGADKKGERVFYPTLKGLKQWNGRRQIDIPAAQFKQGWFAVQDDATGETLGCLFDFPTLDYVDLRRHYYGHYMMFHPRQDRPIGNIRFALSATLGKADQVQRLYERLGMK